MPNIPVGLQMYTLRDLAAQDFVGTFKKVAALGYAGVELAGTGGMTAPELKALLDDLGLKVAGNHVGIEALEADLSAVIDFNLAIGNPNVVIPYLGEDRRKDGTGWKTMAAACNSFGQKLADAGLTLAYHNHSFEFQKFDGVYGLDLLYGNSDPAFLKAEVDTFWVQHGGEDPAAYINKLAGRVAIIHLKDMAPGEERTFAEVGEGILDFPAIAEASKAAGASWYIVEQDVCQRPPLESVEISLNNLRKMGLA